MPPLQQALAHLHLGRLILTALPVLLAQRVQQALRVRPLQLLALPDQLEQTERMALLVQLVLLQ